MSQNGSLQSQPHASTSSQPHMTTPASYHPLPRPLPLPPLVRVDTQAIKQELHDALGENGLAYWKAVNGYLVGGLSRGELESMIRGWLKGEQLYLHNKLLLSLLHNASTPTQAPPVLIRKRKRVPPHDPEFDIDESSIEPKSRIAHWIGSLTSRDRGRVRRIVSQGIKAAEESEAAAVQGQGEGEGQGESSVDGAQGNGAMGLGQEAEEWEARRRKMSTYTPNIHLPPLSLPDRALPSSHQTTTRLQAIAKANDLSVNAADTADVGEFLSLGLDAHVSEIMHGLVHLTGRERPGSETIRMPLAPDPDRDPGHLVNGDTGSHRRGSWRDKSAPGAGAEIDLNSETKPHASPALPKPTVETLQHLLTLNPGIHPLHSSTIYQLETGHTAGQIAAHQAATAGRPPKQQQQVRSAKTANGPGPGLIPGNGTVKGTDARSTVSTDSASVDSKPNISGPPPPLLFGSELGTSIPNGEGEGEGELLADTETDGPLQTDGPIIPMSTSGHHGHFSLPSSVMRGTCGPAFLSHRAEAVGKMLLDSGLLKGDKEDEEQRAGGGDKGGAAQGGKKKKHGLHWKYEDPALILRDVLG